MIQIMKQCHQEVDVTDMTTQTLQEYERDMANLEAIWAPAPRRTGRTSTLLTMNSSMRESERENPFARITKKSKHLGGYKCTFGMDPIDEDFEMDEAKLMKPMTMKKKAVRPIHEKKIGKTTLPVRATHGMPVKNNYLGMTHFGGGKVSAPEKNLDLFSSSIVKSSLRQVNKKQTMVRTMKASKI